MQLHQIRPIHSNHRHKRIGRGSKKGFTSGSGSKGQKSRAGRRFKPLIRDVIKRYPKLRGYKVKELDFPVSIVNLSEIEKAFKAAETVTPRILVTRGLAPFSGGKTPLIKILSRGELTKSLTFAEGCRFSRLAKEKIEKAQGVIVGDKPNIS